MARFPAFTEEVLQTETFARDNTESLRTIQLNFVSVGQEDCQVKDILTST